MQFVKFIAGVASALQEQIVFLRHLRAIRYFRQYSSNEGSLMGLYTNGMENRMNATYLAEAVNYRKPRTFRFLFLMFFCSTSTYATERLPTDTELRAAYCVPILNVEIALSKSSEAWVKSRAESAGTSRPPLGAPQIDWKTELRRFQEVRLDREADLNRIKLYLLPRLTELNSIAIAGAIGAAERDMARVRQQCKECEAETDRDLTCVQEKCSPPQDIAARFALCRSPVWLPF